MSRKFNRIYGGDQTLTNVKDKSNTNVLELETTRSEEKGNGNIKRAIDVNDTTRGETSSDKSNDQSSTSNTKRRKIIDQDSDKIDPVEKLLSLTNLNNDILLMKDDTEFRMDSWNKSQEIIPVNFTKILNDNIRSYYQGRRNYDYGEFTSLGCTDSKPVNNSPYNSESIQDSPSNISAPFFKTVNFNPTPSPNFEDYFSYEDTDEEPITTQPVPNKMRFHYRQKHPNLNLSLNFTTPPSETSEDSSDVFKFLNKRSVLTGKASEMVSTGNFLINDFFL